MSKAEKIILLLLSHHSLIKTSQQQREDEKLAVKRTCNSCSGKYTKKRHCFQRPEYHKAIAKEKHQAGKNNGRAHMPHRSKPGGGSRLPIFAALSVVVNKVDGVVDAEAARNGVYIGGGGIEIIMHPAHQARHQDNGEEIRDHR